MILAAISALLFQVHANAYSLTYIAYIIFYKVILTTESARGLVFTPLWIVAKALAFVALRSR